MRCHLALILKNKSVFNRVSSIKLEVCLTPGSKITIIRLYWISLTYPWPYLRAIEENVYTQEYGQLIDDCVGAEVN